MSDMSDRNERSGHQVDGADRQGQPKDHNNNDSNPAHGRLSNGSGDSGGSAGYEAGQRATHRGGGDPIGPNEEPKLDAAAHTSDDGADDPDGADDDSGSEEPEAAEDDKVGGRYPLPS